MARGRVLKVTILGDASSLDKAFGKAQSAGSKAAKGIAVGAGAAAAAIAGVGIAAAKTATGFESSMSKIVGLVGIAADEVEGMKERTLELAGETARAPQELADALFFITSAGLRGAEAMDALEASAKAASAGLGATQDVAFAAVSAVNAYGAENLNAAQAVDILTNTVRQGNVEAADVAGVLGNVIPIASELGISFDQVGASLAAMTRLGADAASSATSLNSIMTALVKPTSEAEQQLAAVGLSSAELRRQVREEGLLSVLTTLKDSFGENEVAMSNVFGNVRALRGVLNLVGSNAEVTEQIFSSLADSTGTLDEAFGAASQTAEFKFNQAMAKLQAQLVEAGARILPKIIEAMDEFLPAVEAMIPAIGDLIVSLLQFGESVMPLVVGTVETLAPAIENLAAGIEVLTAGTIFAGIEAGNFSAQAKLMAEEIANGRDKTSAFITAVDALQMSGELTREKLDELREAAGLNNEEFLQGTKRAFEITSEFDNVNDGTLVLIDTVQELTKTQEKANLERAHAAEAAKLTAQAEAFFAEEAAKAAEAAEETAESMGTEELAAEELSAALDDATESQESLTDVVRKAADPVFNAVSALTGYQEKLAEVDEDGKRTAEEQLALAEAALDVGAAFEELDPTTAEQALEAIGVALDTDTESVAGLLEEFGIFRDEAGGLGTGISDGIIQGIGDLKGRMSRKLKEVDESIAETRMRLKMQSPSKVVADKLGRPISEGVALGIEQGAPAIGDALGDVARQVEGATIGAPAVGAGVAAGAAAGAAAMVAIDEVTLAAFARILNEIIEDREVPPVTIEATTDADPEDIALALGRALRVRGDV